MQKLTIRCPDDMHLHLRDGAALARSVADSAQRFARAIVMPNLAQPVTTTAQALAYRKRILAALPAEMTFKPLMTLYLTETLSPDEIAVAQQSGHIHGIKLYPAGATTNAEFGVSRMERVYPVLAQMEKLGMPLLVHGEVVGPEVDAFDREAIFIERELAPLMVRFPELRIVFEHITTCEAVDFVRAGSAHLVATVTAHHLLLNRNALFTGGIRPHHYCLPLLKRESHRQALLAAATSGNPKFFLGTDSAPHARHAKESACGCAGIYTAHAAIELYAEAFAAAGALPRLEAFASQYGADFYGLSHNADSVTLEAVSCEVPTGLSFGAEEVVPFRAGEALAWRLCS